MEHSVHARAPSGSNSHTQQGSSLSALVSTLIPFFIISAILVIVFLIAQKFYERVYVPRTYLHTLRRNERTPRPRAGMLSSFKELRGLRDEYVLEHSSIDNYLWLRFFKMLTLMCFVGCLITWPILFPVNATGGGGQSGLDVLSFSNVTPGPRVLAHCFIAWIFLGFVMFLITRETLYFIYLRQAYLLSPFMSSRISTRTILFIDVPESYRDERYLRRIFSEVRTIWFVEDTKGLEDDVEDRDEAAYKLEAGESALIKSFAKRQIKAQKKRSHEEQGTLELDSKDRPTHRTKPIIGKKVDTINWSRSELRRLIPRVSRQQNEQRSNDRATQSALFIEFETVGAAQTCFQQAAHRDPLRMIPREIGMTPDEIIWKNLGKSLWIRKLIQWASTAFILVLVVWWTIPVAFVGFITNLPSLTSRFPWLDFINAIPSQILGVITGLLPTILLVILMALVPIICSALARLFEPTESAVQLRTQSWYFIFQVIQVFLITTFSSGAAAVGAKIAQQPPLAASLLAKNLPKASNFYIAYFIYFGLLQAALQLLNIMPLLFFVLLGKFTDKTPRKMYNRYTQLAGIGWGSMYPKFTNLGVIALSYSAIAPLVLGFATVGFLFLYLAFRYNVFFTLGTTVETKGRAYGRALQQLTVGIYLSELCLIGLFAASTGSSVVALAALILMVIFLIGTIIWHVQMRKLLGRLTVSLPVDLLAEEYRHDDGRESDLEMREANAQAPRLPPIPQEYGHSYDRQNDLERSEPIARDRGLPIAQEYGHPHHRQNDFDRREPNVRGAALPISQEYGRPHDRQNDLEMRHPNVQAPGHLIAQGYGTRTKDEVDGHYQIGRAQTTEAPPAASGMMGRVKAFFMPTKYSSAATLSKHILSPHLAEPVRRYTDKERFQAYMNPALASECPVVWIAKDNYGLSSREIADTNKEVGEGLIITDEGTWMDEKGNTEWKKSQIDMMPIWGEQVIY